MKVPGLYSAYTCNLLRLIEVKCCGRRVVIVVFDLVISDRAELTACDQYCDRSVSKNLYYIGLCWIDE